MYRLRSGIERVGTFIRRHDGRPGIPDTRGSPGIPDTLTACLSPLYNLDELLHHSDLQSTAGRPVNPANASSLRLRTLSDCDKYLLLGSAGACLLVGWLVRSFFRSFVALFTVSRNVEVRFS